MKVVLLYDKLNVGGTEKLLILIANLLSENGHKVSVVLTQSKSKLDHLISSSVNVVYLNRKSKLDVNALKRLSAICRTVDVVHVHAYFNYRYYFLAKTLFGSGKAKVVLHEHSNMFYINRIDKFLFKRLNAFIAVSSKQIKDLQMWKAIAADKIFHLSNIISVTNKVKPKRSPTHRIIMVGNIRREKNYELALAVLSQLHSGIQLDIYGNVNDEAYHEELKDYINQNHLNSRVNIIKGETDVSTHFHQYDLALHTATHETGPLVLMEYLSAGLPFFTSNAGQTPTVIAAHLPDVLMGYEVELWVEKINRFFMLPQEERNSISSRFKLKSYQIIDEKDYYDRLMKVYHFAQQN